MFAPYLAQSLAHIGHTRVAPPAVVVTPYVALFILVQVSACPRRYTTLSLFSLFNNNYFFSTLVSLGIAREVAVQALASY